MVYTLLPERYLGLSLSLLLAWGSTAPGGKRMGEARSTLARRTLTVSRLLRRNGPDGGLPLEGRRRDQRDTGVLAVLSYTTRTTLLKRLMVGATMFALRGMRESVARTNRRAFEYPLLILLSVVGRRLLVSSDDLRLRYLGLELQSLALYVLAAFQRGSAYSTEAGLKYFILGAFASGVYLLGCSLVYGFLGTTSLESIARRVSGDVLPAVTSGFVLMVVARLFKLAVAPFHRWSPDVMEGSPSSSSLFFAAVSKMAILGALIRLCYGPFYGMAFQAGSGERFAILSGLSRVVAVLAALTQRKFKRFLAYSAMGHSGYRLRGLACGTMEGVSATLLYMSIYVRTSLGLWTALISTRDAETGKPVTYLTDVAGLAHGSPALAWTFAVSRFSRAGIPPRAGFMAKVSVFFAARESANYALALVGMLTSVAGAYYYLRVMKMRYFEGATERPVLALSRSSARVISLSRYVTRFLRRSPDLRYTLTQRAAISLI